jgi:GT2 family glycosyltransferase
MSTMTIVIPTFQRPELLGQVLRALEEQEGRFEVIVVCDGEDSATRSLAAQWQSPFPLDWIFSPKNRGQAYARNLGAQRASGEVIVFLDDDTVPAPGWMAAHARYQHGSDIVVLGALEHVYRQSARDVVELFLRETTDEVETELRSFLQHMDATAYPHLWVGLNASVPRSLFLAAGGFDAYLCHVQEDAELASRLEALGAKFIYEPRALLRHVSTKDLARLYFSRAPLFASSDLYRFRQKKQALVRRPMLGALIDSRGARKLNQRLAWHLPRLAVIVAELCFFLGRLTGSRFFLRRWRSLRFAVGYWNQIKAEGFDLSGLRQLLN